MTYPLPGVFVDGSVTVPVSANNLNDYTTAITGLDTRAPIRGSFTNPNGNVTGSPGNVYCNITGGAGTTFWIKESGTGTTSGWVAVSSGGGGSAPDATASSKGIIQLAGGLGGTAASPVVIADSTVQRIEIAQAGSLIGTRKRVNLIQGSNVTLTTTDNSGANSVDVTIAAATSGSSGIPASTVTAKGDLIAASASATVTRLGVGANGQLLIADSTQTSGIKWGLLTPGSAGAAHIIKDEGTAQTNRGAINFVGAGVTVTDDSTNAQTTVTVPGGSGIPLSTVVNVGDLIVGTGTSTVNKLGVSFTDGDVLTADSTNATQGMNWKTPPSTYKTIQGSGLAAAQQNTVNFTGSGATVSNDNPNLRTNVLIPGPTVPTPSDHNLLAWAYDPALTTGSLIVPAGTVTLVKLKIVPNTAITNLWWTVVTAGATPTTNQNWIGVYDTTGARLATSNVDADVASAGVKQKTITAINPTTQYIWVAFVFNGTTNPVMGRATSLGIAAALVNVGLTAANYRFANGAASQTLLPASFTPSTLTQGVSFWGAVS